MIVTRRLTASVVLLVCIAALTLDAASSAARAQTNPCTGTASVAWDTDIETATVEGATVSVPGCPDGEHIGFQLLTDRGDVPDEPLVAVIADEHASFDLTALDIGIEPVTGVRIFMQGEDDDGGPGPTLYVVEVEQHYFNSAGREQRGLRRTVELLVADGGTYLVPAPGAGYLAVDCDQLGVDTTGTLAEGFGTFQATSSGRHLTCQQRTTAGPVDPPPLEPEVLPEVIERVDAPLVDGDGDPRSGSDDGGEATAGAAGEQTANAGGEAGGAVQLAHRRLPVTGGDVLVLAAIGAAMVVVGLPAGLARRRHRKGPAPR